MATHHYSHLRLLGSPRTNVKLLHMFQISFFFSYTCCVIFAYLFSSVAKILTVLICNYTRLLFKIEMCPKDTSLLVVWTHRNTGTTLNARRHFVAWVVKTTTHKHF